MALQDKIKKLREDILAQENNPVPASYQGVTKDRITDVLREIDRFTTDQCDAVFALLDDMSPSFYSLQFKNFPKSIKFCNGATVAHVGCHFGILQRGGGKPDREGRDYWLKPLWEIGAIEKVFFDKTVCLFIPGHPVAKSPYSAYRLADSFKAILTAPENKWHKLLNIWIKSDVVRQRLELQAKLAETSRAQVDTKHCDLILACRDHYAPHFLTNYEVIYIDDSDGDRVSEPERKKLYHAGIKLGLEDAIPDILLWNQKTDHLWVIEAVISDGEVDNHKVVQITALAKRSGKSGVGFTTAYQTWSAAAKRQGKYKNIAPNSYIWIQEDPSKHYLAKAFNT
jgi:hypothetical protein